MAHSNWTLFRERCRIFATKRESESAMLRVLHLDNWKSFSEPVDFTMIAGKETTPRRDPLPRQQEPRAPRCRDLRRECRGKVRPPRCPRSPAGHAARAAQARQRLHYHPHLLLGPDKPSVIGVEIVLDVRDVTSNRQAIVYYEVAFNAGEIVEESLYRVRSEDEQAVFERRGQEVSLYGDLEDDVSLDAASKTVQPNRLFLETCFNAGLIDDEKSLLGSVIEWFKRLTILKRGARYILMPQRIAHDDDFRALSGGG